MWERCNGFRICALAFLLLLPAIGTAELALHIRDAARTTVALETEHDRGCVRLHDHRICTLVQRLVWSPSERTDPRLANRPVVRVHAPAIPDAPPRTSSFARARPRAPPS